MYEFEMILREMLQEDIMSLLYKQFFLPIELEGKRLKKNNEDSDWVFV
tara:strand:- start:915 stop:1058 length:144 start_codon:yes stop_codon:yes gene_type:complete